MRTLRSAPYHSTVRTWHLMGFRDRGKARFSFVGRERVRKEFAKFLAEARDAKTGSTFLVQGPPGVGKTALWHQLAAEAKEKGWAWARISTGNLHAAPELAEAVGKTATTGKSVTAGGAATLSTKMLGMLGAEASGSASRQTEFAGTSINAVLRELGKRKQGTLLILDEAQKVGLLSGSRADGAAETLEQIHEGRCDGPVVLLAAGLGHTEAAFDSVGISRFPRSAVVNLDRLSDKAARELIEEYLREGEKNREPLKGQPALVREILERCHGWPQHLVAYGEAAQRLLPKKWAAHRITAGERGRIIEMGDRVREEYYRRRAHRLSDRERTLLGALVQNPRGITRWGETALTNLAKTAQLGEAGRVSDLLRNAVRGGVLAEIGDEKEYHVPIPSMADWLVERYKYLRRTESARAAELKAAVEAVFPPRAREAEVAPATKTMGSDVRTRSEAMPRGLGSSRSEDLER